MHDGLGHQRGNDQHGQDQEAGQQGDAGSAAHGRSAVYSRSAAPSPVLSRAPPMARALAAPRVVNIDDLRHRARRRLPRVVFDYIDGAAEAEVTLRENRHVFDQVKFRPRAAVVAPSLELATTVLGTRLALPFLLAPVGSTRMFYPRGEVVAAHAAGEAGTGYTLSTLSGCKLEDVKAATTGPCWYQVYLVGGREVAKAAIARARAAGYSALVLTVDTPVSGLRERDVRNGTKELVSRNPVSMFPFLWQFLARPRWLAGFLADGGMMSFPNVVLPGTGPMAYAEVGPALEQSAVSWSDLGWIRDAWGGPIVIKGVLTAEDARRSVEAGAAAIIVSNHGGRQLDGVSATLRALPEVVAAVKGRTEVLMDGGIRRGSDIAKALCLGARAVLIGRAYAYGLGAGGGAGVARAIEILRADLARTLKLLGCASLSDLDRSFVEVPADWRV
jgi:isopentenyl diphosphate isomerase/L-lactate dehydrogenase-like FMN-dependent dehydrogenase